MCFFSSVPTKTVPVKKKNLGRPKTEGAGSVASDTRPGHGRLNHSWPFFPTHLKFNSEFTPEKLPGPKRKPDHLPTIMVHLSLRPPARHPPLC